MTLEAAGDFMICVDQESASLITWKLQSQLKSQNFCCVVRIF